MGWIRAQVRRDAQTADEEFGESEELHRRIAAESELSDAECHQLHDVAHSAAHLVLCKYFGMVGLAKAQTDFEHARDPIPRPVSGELWKLTLDVFVTAAEIACAAAKGDAEATRAGKVTFDQQLLEIGTTGGKAAPSRLKGAVEAFLSQKGFCRGVDIVVALDFDRDYEDEGDGKASKVTLERRAVHIAENVAKHSLMKAACYGHPPGFVFGVGKVIHNKVKAHVHEMQVSKVDGCTVRVTAIRVANLPQLRHLGGACNAAKESPYVNVQLLVPGVLDLSSGAFHAHTKSMGAGGTDCNFTKGTEARVALPLDDRDAAYGACLFVEVLDEPDIKLLAKAERRETKFGSSVVEIGSLVSALEVLEEGEPAACHVNLNLYRDSEMKTHGAPPTGGMVRLCISLERQLAKA